MRLLYFTFMDCTQIITQTTFLALLPKLRRKFNKTNRKQEAEETIQWRQKEQNKTHENDQASEGWNQRNPEKVITMNTTHARVDREIAVHVQVCPLGVTELYVVNLTHM